MSAFARIIAYVFKLIVKLARQILCALCDINEELFFRYEPIIVFLKCGALVSCNCLSHAVLFSV